MSCWYGHGGSWINHGLPHYVSIDRKPESGCEIQNACCGVSGIMLRLQLVTGVADSVNRDSDVLHGSLVLKRLVQPWSQSGRIVCADSFFSRVQAAETLKDIGLNYIGVVKNATKRFPKKVLSEHEFCDRGQHTTYVYKEQNQIELMAVAWVDRDRRYFISTCLSTLPGSQINRVRWRQTSIGPQRISFSISQPKVTEIYYQACSRIDRLNRCRQDDLCLERKFVTQDWSKRVNLSILGMCIVDSWLLYSGSTAHNVKLKQSSFYEYPAVELIENDYGGTSVPQTFESETTNYAPSIRFGIGPHLTPTTKRKKQKKDMSYPIVHKEVVLCVKIVALR